MRGDDRTIHAVLRNGATVVRYDRAGKWYVEHAARGRRQVTLTEAVELAGAPGAHPFLGRPGGKAFDARVRAER